MANVTEFGAKGDGKTDDTAAIGHAVQRGDGRLVFPRGDYLISRPIHVPLDLHGRIALEGSGGAARLVMAAAGPALHLVGTHTRTAQPDHFTEAVWRKERMPTVQNLEIVGAHAAADGIRVEGVMQPTFLGVLIRRCRHGIHLANRDRNVLIADCHIYDNSGVGILLDRVNLHQTIVHGNHVSYCKQGGLKVHGGEVRNIQIVGNDIEYNYDLKADESADVYFDVREGTVREGTISGNTIQAKDSPGGANVRFVGAKDHPNAVGMIAVTGNLLGSQRVTVHLKSCRGITLLGNCMYNGYHHAIVAEDCHNLVLGPNSIDHNSDYSGKSTDHILLKGCRNITLTGLILEHIRPAEVETEASVEIERCETVSLTGCQVIGARLRGIDVRESVLVRVADCTVRGGEGLRAAVRVDAKSTSVMIVNNFLARGADGDLQLPEASGSASGNQMIGR